ncbi:S-DNA-T family DNA segregation ATPase FtsK/SpoIIIE [Microbacterium sp. ZKA21]|uniref:FtsK/SpoIIIE domain-containing protein n=1 Tax=Microbacterium sp. ZKA21 TaxID=3381694 RepID=UPI003D234E49
MTSDSIALPAAVPPPRRPPIPFVAALVPLAAGVVLWTVTGSILSLCFALLGPLMIFGSLLDGIRQRRRETKRLAAEAEAAWTRAEDELAERRRQESARLWRRHPDVARCLTAEPLHEDLPVDAGTAIVLGCGETPSEIRLTGGDDERGREMRRRAVLLDDAPVVVALGRGVCIRAPRTIGLAIARALVAQLCLRYLPSRLVLAGPLPEGWSFGHARSGMRGAWSVGLGLGGEAASAADSVIWVCDQGDAVPDGITTVIDCTDPTDATLRTADGDQRIAVECLSAAQLAELARASAERIGGAAELPERVRLAELAAIEARPGGLAAAIGRRIDGDVVVDLVADGPHAMVTGMTGVGKSELLVTWVAAIAATRAPEEVVFVLADFKGGTAFDPLAGLPHVTAVLTDLDEEGARRGVESLTAELRRRERILAAAGAKDISDPAVRMPRLVIVVDEFAALLQEHPDLGAVFTDIAARGRALGMHLILGTQRAAGVIRDALAANCPLRISLRVSDPADSRMVIGSEDAADLDGGPLARGIAFVRRPQDAAAGAMRVALTGHDHLEEIVTRWSHVERPLGPWLPALPTMLPLDALAPASAGEAIIGLADEPQRQRQPVITLRAGRERGFGVIGGPGAGKSTVLRTLRAQDPTAFTIPSDPERAWDALGVLERGETAASLILCDDVDRLLAAYPTDYALAFADRMEQFIRAAEGRGVVLTAGRSSGTATRVLEALPERMLLRLPTRSEHLAAGGETATFLRERPAGRGHLAAREVQVAWVPSGPDTPASDGPASEDRWHPERRLIGIVGNGSGRLLDGLRSAFPGWEVVPAGPAAAAAGEGEPGAVEGTTGCIIVGDGESWQRDWTRWQRVRAEGEILVIAECAAQLRTMVGVRELAPYARPHRARAWRVLDGRPPTRVVLPRETEAG